MSKYKKFALEYEIILDKVHHDLQGKEKSDLEGILIDQLLNLLAPSELIKIDKEVYQGDLRLKDVLEVAKTYLPSLYELLNKTIEQEFIHLKNNLLNMNMIKIFGETVEN